MKERGISNFIFFSTSQAAGPVPYRHFTVTNREIDAKSTNLDEIKRIDDCQMPYQRQHQTHMSYTSESCRLSSHPVTMAGCAVLSLVCPRLAFSHVLAYNRQMSVLCGTADTLLGACSYGSRWVRILSPAAGPGAGGGPGCGPGSRTPGTPTLSWLVTAPGPALGGQQTPGPGGQRTPWMIIFMARITSRGNKRFVSHGFCHRHSAAAERVDSSSVLHSSLRTMIMYPYRRPLSSIVLYTCFAYDFRCSTLRYSE